MHGDSHPQILIATIAKIRRRILEGKFHLQHMVVENLFFSGEQISICMAPRDPGSI